MMMSNIDDLLSNEWLPVCETLGRERTIKLIDNGTTLDVALLICRFMSEQTKLK